MSTTLAVVLAAASLASPPSTTIEETRTTPTERPSSSQGALVSQPSVDLQSRGGLDGMPQRRGQGSTMLTYDPHLIYETGVNLSPRMALRLTNRLIPSLEQIENDLQSLRVLAVEASNESLTNEERRPIQNEGERRLQHIENYVQQATVGAVFPLLGDLEGAEIRTMQSLTEDVPLLYDLPDVSTSSLGIQYVNLTTLEGAEDSIVQIDGVIEEVTEIRTQQRMLRSRLIETPSDETPDPAGICAGGGSGTWLEAIEACEMMPKIRRENDEHKDVGVRMNEVAEAALDPTLSEHERMQLSERYVYLQDELGTLDESPYGWLDQYPQFGQLNYALVMVPQTAHRPQMGYTWYLTNSMGYHSPCMLEQNVDTVEAAAEALGCIEYFLYSLENYPRELDLMHDVMCTHEVIQERTPHALRGGSHSRALKR